MKNIGLLLILVLLQACSGGAGDSSPVGKTEEFIKQIGDEIEDLEMVASVLDSQNTRVELTQPDNIDRDFDIQVSPIINEADAPIVYIYSHKRVNDVLVQEPFNMFKLNILTEQVTPVDSPEIQESLGRFYKIFSNQYIVTHSPITILNLENGAYSKVANPWADSMRIRSAVKNGNQLCGLARSNKFMAFNYNIVTGQTSTTALPVDLPITGKVLNRLACFGDSIQFAIKSDTELKIYSYNFSSNQYSLIKDVQDINSRIYLLYRNDTHFIGIKDSSKVWQRYSIDGSVLSTVNGFPSAVVNSFRYLRRYVSYEDSNIDDPHYYVQLEDTKNDILEQPKKIKITSGNNFNPAAKKMIKKGDRLFIISKRTNTIYEYNKDSKRFRQLGNPLAYGVYDLALKQDEIYLSVRGNRLLKYDELTPWTYGKLEHRKLKKDSVDQNPKIVKEFSNMNFKNIPMIKNINDEIYLKADLNDRAGSILFNYDILNDSITDSYSTHTDLNINAVNMEDNGLSVTTHFNKRRADVEQGLSAKVISLNSNLSTSGEMVPKQSLSQVKQKQMIGGKMFFLYGRHIFEYSSQESTSTKIQSLEGLRSSNYIRTANDQFLYISQASVKLYNPLTKTERHLYALPQEKAITRIRNMTLFGNSIFFLDQLGVVNEVTLKYADLNLFDSAI